MKFLGIIAAAALAATALAANTTNVAAQDCGPCATKSSVGACVACVKVSYPGQWTDPQMRSWCSRNMAACKKKK